MIISRLKELAGKNKTTKKISTTILMAIGAVTLLLKAIKFIREPEFVIDDEMNDEEDTSSDYYDDEE